MIRGSEESRRQRSARLAGRAPLAITPEWARRPVHVIDLAVRSARQGRALRAKYA